MTRRLVTLATLCMFAALALTSPAAAQSTGVHAQSYAKVGWGRNAPSLVPASEEPPM
jgi:hypothetical protein